MTTRDLDDRRPDLVKAARDAAALLDAQIAAARPAPDFAAMLARARALDPDAVPADPPPLAPVIPLGRADDDADALAPFTAALRGELDAKIAERRMASIPPLAAPGRKRTLAVALGVAFAAAAAVLLVLLLPERLGGGGGSSGVAANADVEPSGAQRTEPAGRPEEHVRTDIRTVPVEPPAPGPELEVAPVVDQPQPEPAHARGRRPRASAPKDMPERSPAPAGPSLEDEAQALWERGELAAAERKYREIVDLAGIGLRAELAYGDIFALARQIRGPEGQAAAWREYLDKFPSGRFADDARAGLCRRAAADERAACWQDYLDRHPRGSHRKQAEAALAREAAP
jgi:hypothetical protein